MTRRAGRRWRWLAIVPVLIALAVAAWRVSRAPCFVLVGDVTCRVETTAPLVGLSFDDGPTPEGLDATLPVLARYGVHATFFVVGESVARRPDLVRRLVAAGHEVGNHGWVHRRMLDLFPGRARAEIARANAAIRAAAGAEPQMFRPPYTKKLTGLPLAVRAAGMTMVTSDLAALPDGDPRRFVRDLLAGIRPGSIVVIHPMFAADATERAALPLLLAGLRRRGLHAVRVGELIRAGRALPAAGPSALAAPTGPGIDKP